MTRSPRVLVVSYLPPIRGGIATWAGTLRDRPLDAGLRLEFLGVPTAGASSGRNLLSGLVRTSWFLLQVAHRMTFTRPDLVHLNCCLSPRGLWRDLFVAVAARAAGRPLVVHHHGSLPDVVPRLSRLSQFALRTLIRVASVNVAVTRPSRRMLERLDPRTEAVYLPNFVEEQLTLRSRSVAHAAPRQRCRAIYAGRLSRDKGTPELLAAARALPGVDFELVGQILADVRDLLDSAPPNVAATGPLARDLVIERLLASHLFVFPSHREGFPNALLEAMALGLPAVATRVGAVSDMIEQGDGGLLVDPGDVAGLTNAIDLLAADRSTRRRMGARNRAACSTRFTLPVIAKSLADIYQRAASLPGRPGLTALARSRDLEPVKTVKERASS